MPEPLIRLQQVSAGYGSLKNPPVLAGLSAALPAGKITALAGPNGSGKSTLLKAICGLLPLRGGSILVEGRPLSAMSRRERARKIAYMPQKRHLPDCTVEELVLQGRFPHRAFFSPYTAADRELAFAAMERLSLLPYAWRPLRSLSGGQQQKAFLAMTLAQGSDLVLLDEPLTFLDIRQQLELLETLRGLQAGGTTVLLVVHDLNTALTFPDCLLLLDKGRLAACGAALELASSGVIDRVFGVKSRAVQDEKQPVYRFSLEEKE